MPTILFDESYSTSMARQVLKDQRSKGILKKRIKKGQVDSMAAKIILEQFLQLEIHEQKNFNEPIAITTD